MKKTSLFLLFVFLAGCGSNEPSYDDRPLSQWKKDFKGPAGPGRRQAVLALGQIGRDPAAVPAVLPTLIEAMKDNEVEVRREAAHSLREIGTAAKPAVPALLEALNDPDKDVRSNSAHALARIDPANSDLVKPLVKMLKDNDSDVRKSAIIALGDMGATAAPAIPALEEMRKDDKLDPDSRQFISLAINGIKGIGK